MLTASPSPLPTMSSMSSYPKLNWTSFETPWNVTQCIALPIITPLEIHLSKGRKFPALPDISGVPGMNCLSILAFSSRGQESEFPPELLNCILADLHGTHQDIHRMQTHVREKVYWPGIDADIADYICQCTICTKHKACPPAQPMLPRDVPDGSWQEITVDYLTHKGGECLLICNLFSKYCFLYKVSTKSAQCLCVHLLELISQYGPTCLLSTDNGPPFAPLLFCSSMSFLALLM